MEMKEQSFKRGGAIATVKIPVTPPPGEVTLTISISQAKALLALLIPGLGTATTYIREKAGSKEADYVASLASEDPFYDIFYVLDDALKAAKQRYF